jgi:hypothetical protein
MEGVLWFLSPGNDEEKAGRGGEGALSLCVGLSVCIYLVSPPPLSSFPHPPPPLQIKKWKRLENW